MAPHTAKKPGLTLCFDPGKHTFGIALFDGARMLALDTIKVDKEPEDQCPARVGRAAFQWSEKVTALYAPAQVITRVVMEWPMVYQGERVKDPNNLLWLTAACGALAVLFHVDTLMVKPRQWKGTVPKEVMTTRIIKRLAVNDAELSLVKLLEAARGETAHHALDAAGMGLWACGRLGVGGPV